ncbi:hypothetical protein ACS0TY_008604 [Phlomoides rotata]
MLPPPPEYLSFLPPTSQIHEPLHQQKLPNPTRINERLHSDLHALHNHLLRPSQGSSASTSGSKGSSAIFPTEDEMVVAQILVDLRLIFMPHLSCIEYLADSNWKPKKRKLTGLERGISFLTRIAAGFIKIRRKNAALAHGLMDQPHQIIPISVLWLMPQYCLHGIA